MKGEFEPQHRPLVELERIFEDMQVRALSELGDEMKGKVLTLLLRVGRQSKVQEDEAREAARQGVHSRLARVWLALGDPKRAASALAAAGKEKAAASVLKETGDWEGRVELYEALGQWGKAAQTLEGHEKFTEAAQAYAKAKDPKNRLRVLAKIGDQEAMVAILAELPGEEAAQLAIRYGTLDAWAQVLTKREAWPELAQLYLAHGQPAIAARAFEEAGLFKDAYQTYAEAGVADGMERCLAKVVETRVEKQDFLGAAQALASAGKLEKAAEIAAAKHPEKAHRWFVEGGYVDRALELARHEARKAEGHDDFVMRATWLGRAGDHIAAATIWEAMGKSRKALTHYEKARAWEGAARCAEFLGKADEAVEHYYRANLGEQAERVKLHGAGQGPGAPEAPAPVPEAEAPRPRKKSRSRRRKKSKDERPEVQAATASEEAPEPAPPAPPDEPEPATEPAPSSEPAPDVSSEGA